MPPRMIVDQQAALGFLIEQTSYIEPEVYRMQFPAIQYPELVPVDTGANEWTKSVTFFSMEAAGRANWFSHLATDMPLADVARSKFEQGIEMAGIGYRYTLEELGQAMQVPGMNLTSERAEAARRAYEEFVDEVALRGDPEKGWTGLINSETVTAVTVAAGGGTGTPLEWDDKSGDEIIADINSALSGVYSTTMQVEMADTILLPVAHYTRLATVPRGPNSDQSLLDWVAKYNVYTAITGQPLSIRAVRGLETAGADGTARMVAYRKDPAVVKMHIPMPHKFMDVWQTGPIYFDVPGIFRLGGVEFRRPGAARYVDGI